MESKHQPFMLRSCRLEKRHPVVYCVNTSDVRNLYQFSEALVSSGVLKQLESHHGILFDELYDRIIGDIGTESVGLILVCNKFTNRDFVDDLTGCS